MPNLGFERYDVDDSDLLRCYITHVRSVITQSWCLPLPLVTFETSDSLAVICLLIPMNISIQCLFESIFNMTHFYHFQHDPFERDTRDIH